MLRLTALLLALLNLALLAWGQGWLTAYGLGQQGLREPERLTRQLRPEALTLLDQAQLQARLAREQAARLCLQSDWLEPAQAERVRAVLAGNWLDGAWQLDRQERPARWLVYMGRYANAADLARKREQLLRLKLRPELLRGELAPGLSLGSFATQAEAEAGLQQLAGRGVRSARVLQAAPGPAYRLRLQELSDESLKQRLEPARTQLPALTPCAAADR